MYEVPTDQPEADGTLEWSSTTVVVVEVRAADHSGLGWTYAGPGCATVVEHKLADICVGSVPLDVPGLNERMARACRNLGRPGLAACAIMGSALSPPPRSTLRRPSWAYWPRAGCQAGLGEAEH